MLLLLITEALGLLSESLTRVQGVENNALGGSGAEADRLFSQPPLKPNVFFRCGSGCLTRIFSLLVVFLGNMGLIEGELDALATLVLFSAMNSSSSSTDSNRIVM